MRSRIIILDVGIKTMAIIEAIRDSGIMIGSIEVEPKQIEDTMERLIDGMITVSGTMNVTIDEERIQKLRAKMVPMAFKAPKDKDVPAFSIKVKEKDWIQPKRFQAFKRKKK